MIEPLPKGITGFWRIGKTPSSNIDKEILNKIIKEFISKVEFRTVILSEPKEDNNFYIISLFSKSEKHIIGINSSYPYYCGIKGEIDWTTIEFYDLPDYVTNVLNSYLTELKSDFLNLEIKKGFLNLLDKSEIEQIEYWQTEKIGNVIFNKYD